MTLFFIGSVKRQFFVAVCEIVIYIPMVVSVIYRSKIVFKNPDFENKILSKVSSRGTYDVFRITIKVYYQYVQNIFKFTCKSLTIETPL